MRKFPRTRQGFTLIELVIIIVILGILATQAIPTYLSLVDDAKKASAKANLGSMRSSISIYYAYKATPMGGESATWPTIAELTDQSTVLNGAPPDNGYDTGAVKNEVTAGAARGVITGAAGLGGWGYIASSGIIWLNTQTTGVSENNW